MKNNEMTLTVREIEQLATSVGLRIDPHHPNDPLSPFPILDDMVSNTPLSKKKTELGFTTPRARPK